MERLKAEVKSLKETAKPSSVVVQRGEYARRWRGVLVCGGVDAIGVSVGFA